MDNGFQRIKMLVVKAKNGDSSAFSELSGMYSPMIDSLTAKYLRLMNDVASGFDDLKQEALVAFYRAAMTYDVTSEKVSFGLYAKICVKNRMISILRKNSSKKNKISSADVSGLPSEKKRRGISSDIEKAASELLTDYEKTVFLMYLDGKPYKDIANSLGRTEKSVDNALFRAKSKLRSGYDM